MTRYITLYFGLILMTLLAGCKTCEKVVSKSETTLEVRHRDIPVIIPERSASVAGMISVDDKGQFSLKKIELNNGEGTKVNLTISPEGEIKADFTAPADTTSVAANDSISTTNVISESIIEKNPSFFERLRTSFQFFVVGLVVGAIIYFIFRKKIKRLWQ